jgi:glycerol uptake facilitator-like aquaporin
MNRRLAAEALGTLALVATVVGSGLMAQAQSPDGGMQLLANSLATAAALYVLVTLFAPVSGARFNPAVTLVMALRDRTRPTAAAAEMAAQVAGGIAGTFLAHAMFAQPLLQVSAHVRSGPGQWLAEAVATFGLVLTILGSLRHAPAQLPALVTLWIGAAYWFTASTSFANPAVTLARTLTASYAGIAPASAPPFVVAQFTGALAAFAAARALFPPEKG